ncbi:MAG: UMP kinase [Clostridia bacterium]|nr:UMP kinase [Clostridia bacterium]
MYKRILLKISGEVLSGKAGHGFDFEVINAVCEKIKTLTEMGVQVGLVIGGGNFWRGRSSGSMDRVRADHIGMLATVMNGLAVADSLEQVGVPARVMTAVEMKQFTETYVRNKAVHHLENGKVCIFSAGTGSPFFSTDTCAALRAAEIGAEVILKATNVDGVYDKDPNKYDDAVKYEKVSYKEVLEKDIKVMDSAAFSICRDQNIDIVVFEFGYEKDENGNVTDKTGNIIKAAAGEEIGTLVTNK